MTHFDDIYEIAADNYGLVTYAQAREAGLVGAELNRYVADGRLRKLGHGVYKLSRWVPTPYDSYAEAVTLAGEGSYLSGSSVLAMHDLALVNPSTVEVSVPGRSRRSLPPWVKAVRADGPAPTAYEGIPSQSVADAIRACRRTVMPERLADAVEDARDGGLLKEREAAELRRELGYDGEGA